MCQRKIVPQRGVLDGWVGIETALYKNGKYPATQFVIFTAALRRYVSLIQDDPLNNLKVIQEINGWVDAGPLARKRIPEGVLVEANGLIAWFSGHMTRTLKETSPGIVMGDAAFVEGASY